ncbi:uncharacterized [Tachysurus ichikawai]
MLCPCVCPGCVSRSLRCSVCGSSSFCTAATLRLASTEDTVPMKRTGNNMSNTKHAFTIRAIRSLNMPHDPVMCFKFDCVAVATD